MEGIMKQTADSLIIIGEEPDRWLVTKVEQVVDIITNHKEFILSSQLNHSSATICNNNTDDYESSSQFSDVPGGRHIPRGF